MIGVFCVDHPASASHPAVSHALYAFSTAKTTSTAEEAPARQSTVRDARSPVERHMVRIPPDATALLSEAE